MKAPNCLLLPSVTSSVWGLSPNACWNFQSSGSVINPPFGTKMVIDGRQMRPGNPPDAQEQADARLGRANNQDALVPPYNTRRITVRSSSIPNCSKRPSARQSCLSFDHTGFEAGIQIMIEHRIRSNSPLSTTELTSNDQMKPVVVFLVVAAILAACCSCSAEHSNQLLNVYVVAHSHDDTGWLLTVDVSLTFSLFLHD